jgi:23S rRNA (cytidine1920-2'-O)/16S rRNA (cytidine1409-2'-O)-methyltransferase
MKKRETPASSTARVPKERLDIVLVERGLAESRVRAQALILGGQVVVNDQRVDKPGTRIEVDAAIRLKDEVMPYVSRGGLKLEAALNQFAVDVNGLVCADIGASTGGFTDCLLQRGAARVHAIDVGYGQLHEKLRKDSRVRSRERVNARYLTETDVPEMVSVAVVDVSFISLLLVLPSLLRFLSPGGVLVALVKPQFEVGPEGIGKGGVVRDESLRREAIERVCRHVAEQQLVVVGVVDSPIAGPAGNVEALLVARKPR